MRFESIEMQIGAGKWTDEVRNRVFDGREGDEGSAEVNVMCCVLW